MDRDQNIECDTEPGSPDLFRCRTELAARQRGSSIAALSGAGCSKLSGSFSRPARRRAVAYLLPLHWNRADAGLGQPFRPGTMPHDAMASIGEALVFEMFNEAPRLGRECGGQHLARTLASDLGKRVKDPSGLVKRNRYGLTLCGEA